MAKETTAKGYTKVKWLKKHHKYAYSEGDTGIVKTTALKDHKLLEGGFVQKFAEWEAAQKEAVAKAKK
ncbi:MAG: hypothetical protein ACPGFK_00590 [Flavobacteriaceae bacterium]